MQSARSTAPAPIKKRRQQSAGVRAKAEEEARQFVARPSVNRTDSFDSDVVPDTPQAPAVRRGRPANTPNTKRERDDEARKRKNENVRKWRVAKKLQSTAFLGWFLALCNKNVFQSSKLFAEPVSVSNRAVSHTSPSTTRNTPERAFIACRFGLLNILQATKETSLTRTCHVRVGRQVTVVTQAPYSRAARSVQHQIC